MKIVITGAKGQLGTELIRMISSMQSELGTVPAQYKDATLVPIDIDELDISKIDAVRSFYEKQGKVDLTINCAAFTNVNLCETEVDTATAANVLGARNLAISAAAQGGKLIHVSTDYVFSGESEQPYKEYDLTCPQSVYGKTKLAGENAVKEQCPKHFIVRTAWLYGLIGNNFVKTMLRLAKEKGAIKVVSDQYGNPTNAEDLAYHLLKLGISEEYGTYHCTGSGTTSWFDFASEIVSLAGIPCEKTPCTTEEYPTPAKRPHYSSLDNRMLRLTVGDDMRDWKAALKSYIEKLKGANML